METTLRSDRSALTATLQHLLRPLKPRLAAPSKHYPPGSPQIQADKNIRKLVKVVERKQDDIYLYDFVLLDEHGVTGTSIPKESKRHLYYIAGGGWQQPPSSQHWRFCAEVALKVPGMAVTIISAPLAPKSPGPESFPLLSKLFDSVLEQSAQKGERSVLGGDSSGGNLALALTLHAAMHNPDARLPDAVLAISPAVDLRTMKKEGPLVALSLKDPVLTIKGHNKEAEVWAHGEDLALPWISPSLADLSQFAKRDVTIIGVSGGYDILTPHSLAFRDACDAAGVKGAWLHWEKQMHCFPLTFMYGLSEGKAGKDWIIDRLGEV